MASGKSIELRIVTPEEEVFSSTVDRVVLPGYDGELGILPGHVPLMTAIQPGEMRYVHDGKTYHLAVGRGFAEVLPNSVSLMTVLAQYEDEIDEEATAAAIERARAALEGEAGQDEEEARRLEGLIMSNLAALKIKRRR